MFSSHHFYLNPTPTNAPIESAIPSGQGSLPMSSSILEHTLMQALGATDGAQHLNRYVQRFYQQYPRRLRCQQPDIVTSLGQMVTHYAQLLPVMAQAIHQCCQRSELQPAANQLMTIISEFFEAMDTHRLEYGLIGILDKAYFGHRMLEEFHDQLRLQAGRALVPWDMALANLIVHSLVGDQYANRLDMAIMEVIDGQDFPVLRWTEQQPNAQDFRCLASHHGLSMGLDQTS